MARTKAFDSTTVLERAMQVFWCKGYNGTSMQDLVEGMGISRQSLYDTYGDKHELFMAALERVKCMGADHFQSFCKSDMPVKEKIGQYLKGVVDDIVADRENKGCMMANSMLELVPEDSAVKKLASTHYQQLEKTLTKLIAQGIQNKEISATHSPEALAAHFINTFHGLRLTGKVKKDRKVLTDIANLALSVLDHP